MKKILLPFLFSALSLSLYAQTEDCGNGVDDDGDGLVDCLDPDCIGGTVPTGTQFNTATNGLGGVLPGGTNDNNWQVSTGSMAGPYAPALVMSSPPGSYYTSPWPDCDWISHNASGSHSGSVDFYYKITFYLPCVNSCGASYSDPGTFCLYMDFFCDNSVDEVYINGIPQSGSIPGVPAADPYFNVGFSASGMISLSLCNDWGPGLNELIIKVSSGGPFAGFLAQNSTTAPPVSGDPTITIPSSSSASMCTTAPPVNLTAASTGGTWTASCGTCLSAAGTFNPTTAGAGTHTVIYSLTTPCPAADTITLTVTDPDDPTIATPTTTVCANAAPFTLSAAGGGTWSAACGTCINTTTGEFDPATAGAGTYVVTYSIAACSVSDTSLVHVLAASNATITTPVSPASVCVNAAPVDCNSLFAGGTWTASCSSCINSSTGVFNPATSGTGTFFIYYSIASSCPDTDTLVLNVLPVPNATINPVAPVCDDDTPFILTAASAGGTWSGAGVSASGTFDPAAVSPGTHVITYNTGGSCPSSDTVSITVGFVNISTVTNNPDCHGYSDGSINIANNGNGVLSYSISGAVSATNSTGVFNGLPAGNYMATISNSYGCSESVLITLADPAAVVAAFTADPMSGFPPLPVNFTNSSVNAATYFWNLDNGTTTTVTNPFTIYEQGVYQVMLVATNGPCADTAYLTIVVDLPSFVTVPNVFTPNGDGINDVLNLAHQNITSLDFKVFNRWGQLMYESGDVTKTWNGKDLGGQLCSEGTYYYLLKAGGGDGKTYDLHGNITLFMK